MNFLARIALHHITSHHITSHSITLHFSTLHYITYTLHHITSHHIASHYITLRYIALYYIAYFVLHCSTSHSTPGYITASIVLIVSRSYQNFGEDVKTKIALGTKANWLGRSTLYYIYFQREWVKLRCFVLTKSWQCTLCCFTCAFQYLLFWIQSQPSKKRNREQNK